MEIRVTSRWHARFPGAHVGVLSIRGVDNTERTTPLDAHKRRVENELREVFGSRSRADLLEHEVLRAYRHFYGAFGNTYHVQLQLESVALKGKPLPNVNPLVDANFVAELQTLVLTAGHDADLLGEPLIIDAASGGETFVQMNGSKKTLRPGDMMMSDGEGVVCTVLYGQDERTPLSPKTRRALYVAYAPSGVPLREVERQLALIRDNVHLFAPEAVTEAVKVYTAGDSAQEASDV